MREDAVNDVEDLESRMHLSIVSKRIAGPFFFKFIVGIKQVGDTLRMHQEI